MYERFWPNIGHPYTKIYFHYKPHTTKKNNISSDGMAYLSGLIIEESLFNNMELL